MKTRIEKRALMTKMTLITWEDFEYQKAFHERQNSFGLSGKLWFQKPSSNKKRFRLENTLFKKNAVMQEKTIGWRKKTMVEIMKT